MIIIIDYGMGNIGSIVNMIKKAGGESRVTDSAADVLDAEKLILPGVGSFDNGVKKLQDLGFTEVLNKRVIEEKVPIMGVCLGMQLFAKSSEEGVLPGLGWIDASVHRFRFESENSQLRVPHMGWNDVEIKKEGVLFNNMFEEPSFYFVHSFHLVCNNPDDVIATTNYGYEFVSAVRHNNIFATQFHPEKSHKYGLLVMKNFVELNINA